jgi:asparagine synthase (glutamine-hydrolysing)
MLRFIALTSDPDDSTSVAGARSIATRLRAIDTQTWEVAFDCPGRLILVSGAHGASNHVYRLSGGRGVVLGKLFSSNPTALRALSEDDAVSADLVASQGRRLVKDYWGRYVAFLHDGSSYRTWIIRDPSGALPCFYATIDGVTLVFSDLAVCLQNRLLSVRIDWNYLSTHVCCPSDFSERTALSGVSEVFQGEAVELCRSQIANRFIAWNPTFFADRRLDSPNEAIELLRDATERCVFAWASCYSSILLELSGGLDSAIILSCLSRSPSAHRLTCLNNYQSDSSCGDERIYARAAANAANVELVEIEDNINLPLHRLFNLQSTPRPGEYIGALQRFPPLRALADARSATAVFSGIGGDQLYFAGPLLLTAADMLFDRGLGRAFVNLSFDLSRKSGRLFWSLLLEVLWAVHISGSRRHIPDQENTLSSAECRASVRTSLASHPWLERAEHLALGKIRHLRSLSVCINAYHPLGDDSDPDFVTPLLSQPLVEATLRIPTYILSANGVNRSAARTAFKDTLPKSIVDRRGKGIVDYNFPIVIERNLRFVRETLLDGVLVKNKLLDRQRLEEALTPPNFHNGHLAGEILCSHLSTEVWARSIEGHCRTELS